VTPSFPERGPESPHPPAERVLTMSGPIITNFTNFNQLGGNGSYLLLIDGQNFNASTTFSMVDLANPQVAWHPASQHGQILNNGTRAEITATPSVPNGGPLPSSGDLRLMAVISGTITPTNSGVTKPFVYTGTFQASRLRVG
jgi:hypothetical protein